MPPRTVLDQIINPGAAAAAQAGPTAVSQGQPGFWDQLQGTAKYYANEAAKDFIPKTPVDAALRMLKTAVDPLGLTGPVGDYEAAYPKALARAGSERVGFKPPLRDVLTAGAGGLAIMPAPGAEAEETGALLKGVYKAVPWSKDASALIHAYGDHVENVSLNWLSRLEGNDYRQSDDEINALARDIEKNGLREPVTVMVGKKSRNAIVGEGNHRIEAARRLNYTHIPVRVVVGQEYGRHQGGTSHLEKDIIPVEGTYFPSDAKPSDVFRSLQEGVLPHQDPNVAPYLSDQDAYHGTEYVYKDIRDSNRLEGATPDARFGTHVAVDPGVANTFGTEFSSGAYKPGANVRKARIPNRNFFYELEQETLPGPRDRLSGDPTHRNRFMFDTADMNRIIGESGFRKRPDLLARQLKAAFRYSDEDATRIAYELAAGRKVRYAPSSAPGQTYQSTLRPGGGKLRDLRQFLRDRSIELPAREDHVELIQAAREALQARGYKGIRYINTAPMEVGAGTGVTDPTSFIVFDPADIKPVGSEMPEWESMLPPNVWDDLSKITP